MWVGEGRGMVLILRKRRIKGLREAVRFPRRLAVSNPQPNAHRYTLQWNQRQSSAWRMSHEMLHVGEPRR
jgi:hypothetical protein